MILVLALGTNTEPPGPEPEPLSAARPARLEDWAAGLASAVVFDRFAQRPRAAADVVRRVERRRHVVQLVVH